MKTRKTLRDCMLVLLVVCFASGGAWAAQSASVMLQEGIYAEEIEGDLDSAIKIYEEIVSQAEQTEQAAAMAMYRIGMCRLKKGDKAQAVTQFQTVTKKYPDNKQLVARAREQLRKLGAAPDVISPATEANLYERLPYDVIRFVGAKYGSLCAEAQGKNLYCNSHIYYVTPDSMAYKGGMGYYLNTSEKTLKSKIRLSGTSYPNQTHYDIAGREMNIEIVADKVRPNFHHIYWTPHEPVGPGQMFYYGWCMNDPLRLPASDAGRYMLEMQNQFGNRVMEAFFLVVPAGAEIVGKSEEYTTRDSISGFDVYCFSKEVPAGDNHQVDVVLALTQGKVESHPGQGGPNLYEHVPGEVLGRIGAKYGSISAEAGAKGLYSNSHIYFVQADMTLHKGGMGYFRNYSDRPAGGRIRLSGTSDPQQSLYDASGRKMAIDIVADSVRPHFYHIYWTPSEPIPPGQMFYYGWSSDEARRLDRGDEGYKIGMQNKFGQRCIETFFLVVPEGTRLTSKTEDFTAKETIADFDIYYWSKEVPPSTSNTVDVKLAPSSGHAEFGAVQTATVYDIDHPKTKDKPCTIDLDKDITVKIPPEQQDRNGSDVARYLAGRGIDAAGEFTSKEAGLIALGMAVEVKPSDAWENLTGAELLVSMSGRKAGAAETTVMKWKDEGEQSVFAFITREGAIGLLQIVNADEKAQKFEVRYKKVSGAAPGLASASDTVSASPRAAADMLPALRGLMVGIFEAIENNDTDTAVELLDKLIPEGKKVVRSMQGTSAQSGVAIGVETLEMIREALANKQMDKVQTLLDALNQMGPGLERAVEEQGEKQRKPYGAQTAE